MTPRASEFPKHCSKCGALYGLESWAALPLVGIQQVPDDPSDTGQPEAYSIELRNCTCKTTLSVMLEGP